MKNWIIREEEYKKENIELNGSRFTIGNGYYGYRGTLDEFRAEELGALTLSGIYDDANGWREIVNAPNPLYTKILYSGKEQDVKTGKILSHIQQLDISNGRVERTTVYETQDGNRLTFTSARIAGCKDAHMLFAEYRLSLEKGGEVELLSGFDKKIWECNGPHFRELTYREQEGALTVRGVTGEKGKILTMAGVLESEKTGEICKRDLEETEEFLLERCVIRLNPGETIRLYKFVAIEKEDRMESCLNRIKHYEAKGYEQAINEVRAERKAQWETLDIEIEGDDQAQIALRHSMYLLLIAAPFGDEAIAIPARGLSGQVYKGAMFWDTEMYMLPMFLYEFPQVARNLVRYRIVHLEQALKKAEEYGYYGAFFPWESQESGEEGCTHHNLTDIFTNRKVRTYFRDKQIHISADVAYGIWKYYEVTEDLSILKEGGARTLFECARFFCSYSYYKKDKMRYEFLDVTGADEYHERVNNNAYTNGMIHYCLEKALEALQVLEEKAPQEYETLCQLPYYEESIEAIRDLKEHIYIVQPGADGVIEQFDGYFKLEDCSLEEIKARIINPKEYLGSPTGLCVETQIGKQADVAMLLCTLPDDYSLSCREKNFDYYEPRTEHGSSLSTCIYALLAAQTGRADWAYKYFMRAAMLDMSGDYKLYLGPLYIGGTHPAANGGAWRVLVEGFAGLRTCGHTISLDPHLPRNWRRIRFGIQIRDNRFRIEITQKEIKVTAAEDNPEKFTLKIAGEKEDEI